MWCVYVCVCVCEVVGAGGTFPIQFVQGLSFLHLQIVLPFAKLRYIFEEKTFFTTIIL